MAATLTEAKLVDMHLESAYLELANLDHAKLIRLLYAVSCREIMR
jgi:uncharacterized protein YjbI with pentapeptide repeats